MSYIINAEKQYMFIHIPKTAGASLIASLKSYNPIHIKNNETIDANYHSTLAHASELYNIKDYYTFAVVRNPYDRIASWYYFRKGVLQKNLKRIIKNNPAKKLQVVNDVNAVTQELADMENFDLWLEQYYDQSWDYTWFKLSTPQNTWITPSVDTLFKFESLNEINKFDLFKNVQIPQKNVSSNKGSYKDLFSTRSKQFAKTFVAEDLDLFKYTF